MNWSKNAAGRWIDMSLYNVGRIAVNIFFHLFYKTEIYGKENIPPESERFIICANHRGYFDPPLVGLAMPYQIGFMAKEELFRNKLFGAFIRKLGAFPIRRGKSDFGALRSAISMAKSSKHIVIFPEGGRSHNNRLRKGKMGAAMVAIKARANILPIGLEGTYKPFTKIKINIGKPIILEEYFDVKTDSKGLQKITDDVLMPTISELSKVPMS